MKGNATQEDALKKALQAAMKGENTALFQWKLTETTGESGGMVDKKITVEVEVPD